MKQKVIFFALVLCNYLSLGFNNRAQSYVENRGQITNEGLVVRSDILYTSTNSGYNTFFFKDGYSFQMYKKNEGTGKHIDCSRKTCMHNLGISRVDVKFLNSNKSSILTGTHKMIDYLNFITVNGEIRDVPQFEVLNYKEIYDGIDMFWEVKNNLQKYSFHVKSGADYKFIQLQINGAKNITISKVGELRIVMEYGELLEEAPTVFQNEKQLAARWLVNGNVISFQIDDYDPELPLIIDPAVRVWGTFYGGIGSDVVRAISTYGNSVYASGETDSYNNIATAGSYDTVLSGIYTNSFLCKFDLNGVRQWGTYYGSGSSCYNDVCKTDINGDIYIAGRAAFSGNYLITPGCHQSIFGGGADIYLAKFNSMGYRIWGTYYGGVENESIGDCSIDINGNLLLSGNTKSTNNISTANSHQPVNNGGEDAFLVKFDSTGQRIWATFYGDLNDDYGSSCATDSAGNVYLAGRTYSTVLISTPLTFQPIFGGTSDGYLVKFSSGGVRQWGTYYGGLLADAVGDVMVAKDGYIYLSGGTSSNNNISTPGSFQPLVSPYNNGFLAKINSVDGNRIWGTYYPAVPVALSSDSESNILISGNVYYSNVQNISTPGSHQQNFAGGSTDGFFAKFDSSGHRNWGSYYGGPGNDYILSVVTDVNEDIYIGGQTSSTNSTLEIATVGCHQINHGSGTYDGFLAKFLGCPNVAPANTTLNPFVCYGSQQLLSAFGDGNLSWYTSQIGGFCLGSGSNFLTPPIYSDTTFYVQDSLCGLATSRTAVHVYLVNIDTSITVSGTTLVSNSSVGTFKWIDCTTGTVLSIDSSFTPVISGNYAVIVSYYGCKDTSACYYIAVPNKINEISSISRLKFYPNPARTQVFFECSGSSTIQLLGIDGQKLQEFKFDGKFILDVSKLSKGIYLVKDLATSKVQMLKIN